MTGQYPTRTGRSYATELHSKSVGLVRYADDFVVFCRTMEEAEEVRQKLSDWFKRRGLQFSEEKTRIVHLDDGFDFLGFNVRRYPASNSKTGRRLLTKPSKKSVKAIRQKLKGTFRQQRGTTVETLVLNVNPMIRGWANYFRTGTSAATFGRLDHYVYGLQWRWAGWRHPHKSSAWKRNRYWGNWKDKNNWVFGKPDFRMSMFSHTPIKRHTLIRRFASWDDPDLEGYWETRMQRETAKSLSKFRRHLAEQQNWKCPVCGDHLLNGEALHEHHDVPRKEGGDDAKGNLRLLHLYCHQAVHGAKRPTPIA